jgi:hypothetical protein
MEKHLEEFIVDNWISTEFGKSYDIYDEDPDRPGQQFPTDTGRIDILALNKDKKSLLVLELKKGRASDAAVGQILRYINFVQEEIAEPGQSVKWYDHRGGAGVLRDGQVRIPKTLHRVRFRRVALVPAVQVVCGHRGGTLDDYPHRKGVPKMALG